MPEQIYPHKPNSLVWALIAVAVVIVVLIIASLLGTQPTSAPAVPNAGTAPDTASANLPPAPPPPASQPEPLPASTLDQNLEGASASLDALDNLNQDDAAAVDDVPSDLDSFDRQLDNL